MLDLVAGLQWVRDNIAQFGGDPGSVMVFGESGGGLKTSTLLAMPQAKGLFHGAAIQSGALLRSNTRERANESAKALLAALGISSNRVDEMQSIPAERLLAAMGGASGRQGRGPAGAAAMQFSPFVDGKIMPAHPFDPVSATIPILIGCNTHEQAYFVLSRDATGFDLDEAGLRQRTEGLVGEEEAPQLIELYKRDHPRANPGELYLLMASDRGSRMTSLAVAERKCEQGKASVYMYLFAWHTPALGGKLGAPHTVEIPFVFDNTDVPKVMTTRSPEERALAARTSEAWIQFAKTGNPNHKGLPEWPAYSPKDRATMRFDVACRMMNDLGGEEREFWQRL